MKDMGEEEKMSETSSVTAAERENEELCDAQVQTSFHKSFHSRGDSFREMASVHEDVDEDQDEFQWADLSEMEEEYEEYEFSFEPIEGDKLEFVNERRIWKAEMSMN